MFLEKYFLSASRQKAESEAKQSSTSRSSCGPDARSFYFKPEHSAHKTFAREQPEDRKTIDNNLFSRL